MAATAGCNASRKAEKIIHLLSGVTRGGWLAGLLYVADNRFLHFNRPIHAARFDDQMIQARILGHIRDAMPVALVLHGILYWTPANGAVYHDVE